MGEGLEDGQLFQKVVDDVPALLVGLPLPQTLHLPRTRPRQIACQKTRHDVDTSSSIEEALHHSPSRGTALLLSFISDPSIEAGVIYC